MKIDMLYLGLKGLIRQRKGLTNIEITAATYNVVVSYFTCSC